MNLEEKYYHWLWGDNNIRTDRPNYLINLELGISVKFDYSNSFFANYDEFFNGIADVQFWNGDRPNKDELESILTDAWNFLCIEERILDNTLSEDELDEFNL